jgi:3-polyprenyl-4-hydroxybenzoate decarboxylase
MRLNVGMSGVSGAIYGTRLLHAGPQSIDDIVDHSVGPVLGPFGIDSGLARHWQGARKRVATRESH